MMDRLKDLEHHVEEAYYLVNEYEEIIRTAGEPDLKLRSKRKREDQWDLIRGYLEEYVRQLRGRRMPEWLTQIASHFPEYYYGDSPAQILANNVRAWLEALGYRVSDGFTTSEDCVDLTVHLQTDIPLYGKVIQQILVRCNEGEVEASDVRRIAQDLGTLQVGRGQIIASRRITPAARELASKSTTVEAMTFDELIESTSQFGRYFDWLENEVKSMGIDVGFVDLGCQKVEIDPDTYEELGTSHYGEDQGWIDGYVDLWLDDPSKEHLSILGEFGSGKTWFTLHYAYRMLAKYKQSVRAGTERPRIPILIQLREYSHAGDIKALLSRFFFEKHQIRLPGYQAFDQLNRMGKLFLIFDGFDEMAQKLDYDKVIRQFWELVKVVVPNAKVLLTCRTEHFRYAREGREVLRGEIHPVRQELPLSPPRFEVLELEPLNSTQIRSVLSLHTDSETVEQILAEPHLSDLARRPILIKLILEALPNLSPDIPRNIANIYLSAINRKLERDILEGRTFTSQADKLFFMTELAWEMFARDISKIHYREIPVRIGAYLGVDTRDDLDAYDYDLRTQTLLIRDEDGYYEFAHKSILEFFIARKLVGEMRSRQFHAMNQEIASTEVVAFVRQLITLDELFSLLEALPTIEGHLIHFNVYHIVGGFSARDFHDKDIEGVARHLLESETSPYAKYRFLYWVVQNFDDQEFQDQAEQLLRTEQESFAKYARSTWLRYYGGPKGLTNVLKERMFHPIHSRLTPLIYTLMFEEIGNPEIADWLEENLFRVPDRFVADVQRTITILRNRKPQLPN